MKPLIVGTLLVTAALCYSPSASALDERYTVRDEQGGVVRNTFDKCVRTKWHAEGDPCAPVAAKQEVTQYVRVPIAKEERTIYFDFNKAAITPDSIAKLNSLAGKLKSDKQVKGARIVGFADRIGTQSYNERLSQKRALNVTNYLTSQGVVNAQVAETRWLGESEPKTNCPDTLSRADLIECLQRDRRVEVEVDYLPETGTR